MEKRKVAVVVGGQTCSFYSDDPDEYIAALARRANAVMSETAAYSDLSAYKNAVLSVLSLTDTLMRAEKEKAERAESERAESERMESERPEPGSKKAAEAAPEARKPRKPSAKGAWEDKDQVTIWDLMT